MTRRRLPAQFGDPRAGWWSLRSLASLSTPELTAGMSHTSPRPRGALPHDVVVQYKSLAGALDNRGSVGGDLLLAADLCQWP